MNATVLLVLSLLSSVVAGSLSAQGKRPYELPAGARFTAEEVQPVADEDGWRIAGTLNLPKGEAPAGGWPAVFFVSGSGSQDRHGAAAGIDIGTWEVLDAVANAGFAVLRVDDRGTGGTPVGPDGVAPAEIGYQDLIGDARRCVQWLRGRADVDGDKVFLIGHSEGGLTASILAGEGLCAGLVCMAAPGRNLYEVVYGQVKAANAPFPEAVRKVNLAIQKEFQDAAKEGREPDFAVQGKALEAQLRTVWKQQMEPALKWFHQHFNLDVPAILGKVACPAFVAQGAADIQVDPRKDARELARGLLAGACTDLTFQLYEDLDHLFKPCGGQQSSVARYREARRVDAVFLAHLLAWLQART